MFLCSEISEDAKRLFITFCEIKHSPYLFSRPSWLDIVCDKDWNVCVAVRDDSVIGYFTYVRTHTRVPIPWLGKITQPLISAPSGPWLADFEGSAYNKIGTSHDVLRGLYAAIPSSRSVLSGWRHNVLFNWLPLTWDGFRQTTRFTYLLDLRQSEELLWEGLEGKLRREVRKAVSRFDLRVERSVEIDEFVRVITETYERKGQRSPFSSAYLKKVIPQLTAAGYGRCYGAVNSTQDLHAVIFIASDNETSFYIMGGGSKAHRTSGAHTLLMWTAICEAKRMGHKYFDFEGSMNQNIEKFFRAFGALPTPYTRVFKDRITGIFR